MNKIASVLLFDVGDGMKETSSDAEVSDFSRMKECIGKIILKKIFSGDSDEVGIIAFGSNQTNNDLAVNDTSRYRNINVIHPLQVPSIDMFNVFNQVALSSEEISDWVQALVVALDFMKNYTQGKRFKSKQILLFSNYLSELDYKQQIFDTIVTCLQADSIKLIIVGTDLSDEPEDGFPSNLVNLNSLYTRLEDSVSLTTDELAESMKYFEKKRKTGRVTSVLLDIGSNIRIPVGWLKLTGEPQRISSWVPYSESRVSQILKKEPESGEIEIPMEETCAGEIDPERGETVIPTKETSAVGAEMEPSMEERLSRPPVGVIDEDEDDDVDDYVSVRVVTERQKVARFGSTKVVLSYADLESLKRQTGFPCLSILMFTKKRNINPTMFVGKDIYGVVPKPGSKHSQAMLAALIDALLKTKKVGIARRIAVRNGKVQIGALLPFSDDKGKHLFFMKLPTAEWVQPYPRCREITADQSSENLNLINELITKMTLPNDLVEEGKGVLIRNPNFQLRCHILSQRLLDENSDPAGQQPEFIKSLTHLHSELQDQARPTVEAILTKFPDLDPNLRIARKKKFMANLKKHMNNNAGGTNNTVVKKDDPSTTAAAGTAAAPEDEDDEESMSKYFTDDLSDEESQNTAALLFN